MGLTHQQLFERYLFAGAITRDATAYAALFTEDGVYEAPLAPDGHPLHRPLIGRDAIRTGIALYHRQPTYQAGLNRDRSRSALHETADPDVFIAELDVAFDDPDRGPTRMSLVQIFRRRGDEIAVLRDYFTEEPADA